MENKGLFILFPHSAKLSNGLCPICTTVISVAKMHVSKSEDTRTMVDDIRDTTMLRNYLQPTRGRLKYPVSTATAFIQTMKVCDMKWFLP